MDLSSTTIGRADIVSCRVCLGAVCSPIALLPSCMIQTSRIWPLAVAACGVQTASSSTNSSSRPLRKSHKVMLPKSFDLISPLARDECVRRLRANTESSWFPAFSSNKPVIGRVEDTAFQIHKFIRYQNSFAPCLSAELDDEDGRTRVRCRLGLHPAVVP